MQRTFCVRLLGKKSCAPLELVGSIVAAAAAVPNALLVSVLPKPTAAERLLLGVIGIYLRVRMYLVTIHANDNVAKGAAIFILHLSGASMRLKSF